MKMLDVPQSGSVAGVTSSRNRFGQYKRTRAMPTNPNTDAQSSVRASMASLAAAWADLTDAQRTAWNTLAGGMGVTDSLGSVVYPTGFNRFVGTNLTRSRIGLAQLDDAPPSSIAPAAPVVVLNPVFGAPVVAVTGWTVGERATVSAAPYGRPGREYFSDFRFLQGVVAASTSANVNIEDGLQAKFGAYVHGLVLAVRFDRLDASCLLISRTVLRGVFFTEALAAAASRTRRKSE